MKDLYLILYNSACCVGWAGVLGLSLFSLVTSDKASLTDKLAEIHGFQEVSLLLTISQTAALLEIVHAILGLVRSPVMVTFMQVMSRIVALVAVEQSIDAQSK
jgi:very-long-chain (3R)-3-hydroxyacyl-CoA dehydratase